MTEQTTTDQFLTGRRALPPVEPGDEFAAQIADQVESFLIALRAVAAEGDAGRSISCSCSRSARSCSPAPASAPRSTSRPRRTTSPTSGPTPTSTACGCVWRTCSVTSTPTASSSTPRPRAGRQPALRRPHQHRQRPRERPASLPAGNTAEALWWWQFSYVSSWGNLAGAMLNALLSVVAHDRLDVEFTGELDQVAAANEMLESPPEPPSRIEAASTSVARGAVPSFPSP